MVVRSRKFAGSSLQLAVSPVIESLEGRSLFATTTIQPLPFALEFTSDRGEILDKDGQGTGFTRVQTNKNGTQYDASKIDLDTAAGVLKITTSGTSAAGGNYNGDNTLVNGLETQFNAQTSGWSVTTRLKGPLSFIDNPSEQAGVTFGPDQDNYVKLVAVAQPNGQFLQFIDEQTTNGVYSHALQGSNINNTYTSIGSFASITTLDLRLVGDSATGKVTAFYSVNGAAFVKIAAELTLTGTKKDAFFSAAARAGLIAMHKNDLGAMTATFDRFEIQAGAPVAQRPSVVSSDPADGQINIVRDISIRNSLNLPNVGAGVDDATLNANTVKLIRTSDGAVVPGDIDTSGGGDTINFAPSVLLDANTNYTFTITSGVKDTSGAAFIPWTFSFTTGTQSTAVNTNYSFEKVALGAATGHDYSAVKMGPDGKLYAASLDGLIQRFTINADGTLGAAEDITSLQTANGGNRFLTGIAFDPASTASNLILWVTHSYYALTGAPDWTGKISKLTGPNLATVTDVVKNLPRSIRDHTTNQIAFSPTDGKLYFTQGSMSAMGAPDNTWGLRAEHLLSGAVLRLDPSLIPNGTVLDAKTDSGGTYNPFAPNAPLIIYGQGVRNAYDLLFHSNGHLYVPTNGSAPGGNSPAGGGAPALNDIREVMNDYLFDVIQGGYYGHPNPTLNHFVLNGGNPNGTVDPAEVLAYPVGTQPDANYKGFAYDFGENESPNGVIEYKSNGTAFGGTLDGKILVVRYSVGNDVVALTPGAGGAITGVNVNIPGLTTFNDPLDIEVNPANGFIYVVEHGGQKITLARPITPGANAEVDKKKLVFNDTTSSSTSQTQVVTVKNTGTGPLVLAADAFTVTGTDAARWTLTKPTLPLTLQPGESTSVSVKFLAASVRLYNGTLVIKTSDPDTPTINVKLRGLGTSGTGGSNEPSLQRVLDLHEIPIVTGDKDPLTTFLYDASNPLNVPNDELDIPRFVKAGTGPVTFEPLAVFGASTGGTAFRAGYYTPGNPTDRTQLFTFAQSQEQSVAPQAVGNLFFDPGTAAFGLYVDAPKFGARTVYSEDLLNTWDPDATNRNKVRVYAYKDSAGNVVPNAYVVAFEEAEFNTPDNQDVVYILRNVKAAPAGAEIGFENLDGAPFNDRMIFDRIGTLDPVVPNYVKDTGTLRIRNTGTSDLTISGMSITSSWQLVGAPAVPFTVPANGGFVDLTIKFIATTGTIQTGQLAITSNDADEPTTIIQLAGWRQAASENPEPTLVQQVQLLGYGTTILKAGQTLNHGGLVERVGDEVLSPYWQRADASKTIDVRQLAAYHTQGNTANVRYFTKGTTTGTILFTHNAADGQTFLPRVTGTLAPATASFSNAGTFGFRVDNEYSDPALNGTSDGGHHMRFFVAKDKNGLVIPDTYLMTMDYAAINYDYQDNVYLISNIKPESGPGAPTGVTATSTGDGIALNWADNTEANLRGYNVYRSDVDGGTYVKVNGALLLQSDFVDTTAPLAATSYYRIVAVDFNGTESAPAVAQAVRAADGVPPAAPGGLTATGTTGGIVLDWNNNTEVDLAGYDVYRSSALNGTYAKLNTSILTTSDYVDATAPANVASYYRVIAVDTSANASTPAAANAIRPASDTTAPATPTALTATGSSGGILVDWANNSEGDLAGYNIYRSDAQFGTYVKLNTSALLAASQYNDGAAPAGTSWYRVTAVDASGNESLSASVSGVRPGDTVAPAAPSGLVLTPSAGGILLDWADNVEPDLAGYQVWRATSPGGPFTHLTPGPLLTSSTFNDTTAPSGVVSYYAIFALDSSGNASPALNGNATRPAAASAPAAPSALTATGATGGITLDWADNTETNLAGYNVYRSTSAGGTFVKVNTSGLVAASTFVDANAPTGATSFYRVTAVNSSAMESSPATANALRPGTAQTPFKGTPFALGTTPITIQAEDFDLGGNNVAYFDADATSNRGGAYRNEGVDIKTIAGTTGQYRISDAIQGEWLEYTTDVATTGTYLMEFRVGSRDAGSKFHVEIDGVNVTGAMAVPVTGGFDTFTTISKSLTLGAGQQVIRFVFDEPGSAGFGAAFDWMRVTQQIATPANLTVSGSTNGIQLDWANNAEANLAGYYVYRSSTLNGTYTKVSGTSPITASDFLDTGAPSGQTSFYRVTAVNSASLESAPAEGSALRPAGDTTPPGVPQNLLATGGASSITLDWTDNPEVDLTGYNVYFAATLNGTYTKLNTSGIVMTSGFEDTTVAAGATRFYKVTSVDTSGNESAQSTPASATRSGTSATITKTAVADAMVRGGSANANLNFGSQTTFEAKESKDASLVRRSFIKFDLSGVTTVTSAKVRLFGYLVDVTAAKTVQLNGTNDAAWTEGGITFNNAPTITTSLGTKSITGAGAANGAFYEWDITSYLQAAIAAGKTDVTLAVTAVSTEARIGFNSKEAASNQPALVITT